jgi:hypothetical protein
MGRGADGMLVCRVFFLRLLVVVEKPAVTAAGGTKSPIDEMVNL